jgi:putative oxidoreductase
MNIIDRYTALAPKILGIMRILMGTLFALHGSQKVLGFFGGMPPDAPAAIVWTAGPIEFVGGILIALGLFTRLAAFLCSGLMAFAYFIGHAPTGFWPVTNGGEPAFFFCWLFLYYSAQGPGAFALDNLRKRSPQAGGVEPRQRAAVTGVEA